VVSSHITVPLNLYSTSFSFQLLLTILVTATASLNHTRWNGREWITVSDTIVYRSARELVHVEAGAREGNCELGNHDVTATDIVIQLHTLLHAIHYNVKHLHVSSMAIYHMNLS